MSTLICGELWDGAAGSDAFTASITAQSHSANYSAIREQILCTPVIDSLVINDRGEGGCPDSDTLRSSFQSSRKIASIVVTSPSCAESMKFYARARYFLRARESN